MDLSPASASSPATETNATTPQFTFIPPARTKVLELPEKDRKRAEITASNLTNELENGPARTAILRIGIVSEESHVRTRAGDRTGWSALKVEKRHQRATVPPKAHDGTERMRRPPPRLAVSAPVMPRGALGMSRPVPASPMGNAWSGEHYWKPQFSSSVPASPIVEEVEAGTPSDAVRRAMYEAVVADVAKSACELKIEAVQRGERMPDVEADVIAAMTVLEEKNTSYASSHEMPIPKEVSSTADAFAEQTKRAVAQNTIHNFDELHNTPDWLQLERTLLQYTTVLDYAQANLRIIKGSRVGAGLEPSVSGYSIVYATQILEEKIRKLKARESYEEDSGDEMVEYGKFLKSISEELTMEEKPRKARREVAESSLGTRRLKGKAPSVRDLATWASELKELPEENEPATATKENFF